MLSLEFCSKDFVHITLFDQPLKSLLEWFDALILSCFVLAILFFSNLICFIVVSSVADDDDDDDDDGCACCGSQSATFVVRHTSARERHRQCLPQRPHNALTVHD